MRRQGSAGSAAAAEAGAVARMKRSSAATTAAASSGEAEGAMSCRLGWRESTPALCPTPCASWPVTGTRPREDCSEHLYTWAMLEPISHRSVSDDVFDQLREAIMSGRYRPGERLPSQRALAADLGVNMSSVREALGRLEQLRLLEVRHGSATRVLDWRRSGGLESLALEHGAGGPLLGDLFEARLLLLVESARLAAARRSTEQAAALLDLACAAAGADDGQTALLADWAFMSALVEAAGNIVFQLIMNSVRELYLPRMDAFAGLVSEQQELAPLYLEAARAVEAGDGEVAAAAIDRLASLQAAAMAG